MNLKLFFLFILSLSIAHCQSKQTEIWEPVPEIIESTDFSTAPSEDKTCNLFDAILFEILQTDEISSKVIFLLKFL